MKRKIEIEDSMQERVESVCEEIKDRFNEIMAENPDYDSDDVYQEIADEVHEIVDSNTPIYYSDIDALYYLYGNEVEEAYENAGCYTEKPENYRQVCIFFYLEEQAHECIRELQDNLN